MEHVNVKVTFGTLFGGRDLEAERIDEAESIALFKHRAVTRITNAFPDVERITVKIVADLGLVEVDGEAFTAETSQIEAIIDPLTSGDDYIVHEEIPCSYCGEESSYEVEGHGKGEVLNLCHGCGTGRDDYAEATFIYADGCGDRHTFRAHSGELGKVLVDEYYEEVATSGDQLGAWEDPSAPEVILDLWKSVHRVQTDAWRGYWDVRCPDGWADPLDVGWFGTLDGYNLRGNAGAFREVWEEQGIEPDFPAVLVITLTSNVCSAGIDVFVPDNEGTKQAWEQYLKNDEAYAEDPDAYGVVYN